MPMRNTDACSPGLTPEFSCVGAGLELSVVWSAARPRQLQRFVRWRYGAISRRAICPSTSAIRTCRPGRIGPP
jgi:hypothetical protein